MKPDQYLVDFKKMVLHSLDMIGSIDKDGYILFVNNAFRDILGYESDEVIGRHYADFLHPDDSLATDQAIKDTVTIGSKTNFVNRYFHKNGHAIHIRWSGSWAEEDEVLYCIGRNLSEHEMLHYRLEESEQRYKSLFDNNPDIIFVENKQGVVTEVNKQFLSIFRVSEQQIVGSHAASFLPTDKAVVNNNYLQQALLGNYMRYDFELVLEGQVKIFDTLKYPIIVSGEIVGVHTIIKDITPMVRSHETVERQAKRLKTIFESITDAFFMLDRDWKLTYINSEAEKLLSLNRTYHIGKNVWTEFPSEVNGEFYKQYLHAAQTGEAVHFEAYYAATNIWVEVKAFPSEEGLSIYFDDITERVKAQQELEMLSIVASKSINSVLIMDKHRHIEWVNEGFTNITGYTFAEVAGKAPYSLLAGEETDGTTIRRIIERADQALPVREELLVYTKSGEKRWLKIEANPVFDEGGNLVRFIGIQTDITERVQARIELEKLSLVASKTNSSVLIADKDWRIEWVNEGFIRLTGYSMAEVVGKRPSQFLHSPKTDRTTYEQLEEKLFRGEPISLEKLNAKKGGEDVWLKIDITAIFDKGGELAGFVEVQTDITALKESEMQLNKLAKDLHRQNSDLQQFTYMLSHNLRAPVANVLGLADLLVKVPKENAAFDNSLFKLQESALHLDKVLRDMNTILSIRDNKGNLELHFVNILQVVNQVVASLQDLLHTSEAHLVIDLSDTLEVKANKAYVYSVFHNLLSNAIKYRAANRQLQITIKCASHTSMGVVIACSDNGLGFDMGKANADVFKLYKRFHTHVAGSGIGLYLTKSHIEAMGGQIQVYSEVDAGTKFLIYLPA